MSRLPRLHPSSSPDRHQSGPSMSFSTRQGSLKRKAQDENFNIAEQQPRKLAAIAEADTNQPLRPSKAAISKLGKGPPPLTKPRAPPLTTRRTDRATSAPPRPVAAVRPPARPTAVKPTRGTSTTVDGKRFQALEEQISSIAAAREADTARLAADASRLAADMEAERSKVAELQANQRAMSQQLTAAKNQDIARQRELDHASEEIYELQKRHSRQLEEKETELRRKDREVRELKEELRAFQDDLERERETVKSLKATISHQSTAHVALSTQVSAMQAQQAAMQAQSDVALRDKLDITLELEAERKRRVELEQELREAETLRRKLHNQVQELKGNIRVFCRVRPLLSSDMPLATPMLSPSSTGSGITTPTDSPDPEEEIKRREEYRAQMGFPDKMDHKEIVLRSSSESATGQERKDEWAFTFDRVFEPHSTQAEVFEEISQLAQSCTDGYNVCVFAYGQTGSGKSFTMEGGQSEATTGMIPRAVEQVFRVAEELKSKGWEYKMEGQFLEIYNETINDLLGKGEFDKKKHEIKHDSKTGRTTVTDVNVLPLASATQVRTLLSLAQSRRTVAATLMNERSSRSHSVFTLRIRGENPLTGEACEGSLNLVDLAGSERLEKSGAAGDKDRLKETQSINKSLSALGDVIAALGEKGEGKSDKHIPYRNSKLTYLLQNSLSGNSKTLMVLNLSPLAGHLNESLCSLRFATKVNNTTIGTAKKQSRMAGSS
ncbi:uncharacterized protein FIBRA_03902 [Fibroporia radiculosa]|uniref:Kinesin-like protein n=1 Tax=Fibroporia radiculosa TaxID=599839 RepID=J4H2N5_9APHY|nr:uncharacterized protein FIBRA_03902 [Fibroporia radiculosa]CCM01834.1 predicted protein [Fibroporia radiculosa]